MLAIQLSEVLFSCVDMDDHNAEYHALWKIQIVPKRTSLSLLIFRL